MPSQVILVITAAVIAAILISAAAVLFLTNRSVCHLGLQNVRSINKSNNSDFYIKEIAFFQVNANV